MQIEYVMDRHQIPFPIFCKFKLINNFYSPRNDLSGEIFLTIGKNLFTQKLAISLVSFIPTFCRMLDHLSWIKIVCFSFWKYADMTQIGI